jgi:hypothetical protein
LRCLQLFLRCLQLFLRCLQRVEVHEARLPSFLDWRDAELLNSCWSWSSARSRAVLVLDGGAVEFTRGHCPAGSSGRGRSGTCTRRRSRRASGRMDRREGTSLRGRRSGRGRGSSQGEDMTRAGVSATALRQVRQGTRVIWRLRAGAVDQSGSGPLARVGMQVLAVRQRGRQLGRLGASREQGSGGAQVELLPGRESTGGQQEQERCARARVGGRGSRGRVSRST